MLRRREFLQAFGAGAVTAAAPRVAFANAQTDARLVMVVLRGAMDGLSLAPPYADTHYRELRGRIALSPPGVDGGALKLDGLFALHPAMSHTHQLYQSKQALVVHAVASPYRARSHFDGQDVLEHGLTSVGASRSGWLNRALLPLNAGNHDAAIALSQTTPLILRGTNSVTSWAPSRLPDTDDDTLARLARLYETDTFFSTRLSQAMSAQQIAGEMGGGRRSGGRAARLRETFRQAARFLSAEDGPRVAVVESGGWDTHANQGAATGQLANKLKALDSGIGALHEELGLRWRNTVVLVVTEFGRTAKINGTRGTDHGTGSAALMLGGAVNGGRVIADWPGLAPGALYQGRDLHPTTDIRSLFKGVLREHLGIDTALIDREVFPDGGALPALSGLVRT